MIQVIAKVIEMNVYLDANIIYDLLLGLASSRRMLDEDDFETNGRRRSEYLYNLIYARDQLMDYVAFEDTVRNGRIGIFTSRFSEFEAFGAAYKDDFVSLLIGRLNFPMSYVLSKVAPKSVFRSILKRHIENYENGEEMANWCTEFPPRGVGFTSISDIYASMNYVEDESIDFSQEEYRDIIGELSRFNMLASDIVHIIICKQNSIDYLLTRDRDFHELKDLIQEKAGIAVIKGLREALDLSRRSD